MKSTTRWIFLCLLNLFIVSLLGTIMRVNAVLPIEGVLHKNFREAHSHFAFYAWATALIYVFSTQFLSENIKGIRLRKYQILMLINQIASYGMIVTFAYRSYYWGSIVCSSVALLGSFAYFFFLLKEYSKNKIPLMQWLIAGGFFGVFSSLGIFSLAYLMAHKEAPAALQRAAIYFYLHYQYNGFFLMSGIGFLLFWLKKQGVIWSKKVEHLIFYPLFFGALLGYSLSILWMKALPTVFYLFSMLVALVQLLGVGVLARVIIQHWRGISAGWQGIRKGLFYTFSTALVLKFGLQFVSSSPFFVPFFDNLSLVIAYLHLVLLMGISLLFIWLIFLQEPFKSRLNRVKTPLFLLILGIIFNEILLILSGLMPIPYLLGPKLLIVASALMATALLMMLIKLKSKS